MSYAIFRVEPINKISDLAQIGAHNKRDKKEYKSNPDIDITKTKNNIEIVPLRDKYIKAYYDKTNKYKKEHDKRMETIRDDRKKTFKQMLDDANSVVADELLFTSDFDFFKNMNKKEIKKWADTCMEFIYNDIGYTKEQILHEHFTWMKKHHTYIGINKLSNNSILFSNPKGNYATTKMITHIIDKYSASLNKNIHPHAFRHSRAMHLLEAVVNIIYIRDFLGHNSIETTEIYAKVNENIKRQAITNAYDFDISKNLNDWNADDDLLKELLNI